MENMDEKLFIGTLVSIRERVYEYIRNRILSGQISPSTRVIETKLAREIGTSRTPVREALHLLESEGLLESIPRVGYRVKEIKSDDVEEICEIRVINETLACRWAMERMRPEALKAIEKNLETAKDEAEAGRPETFVEHDAEFHELLVRASGSRRLLELCQMLRRHMLRYRIESLYLSEIVFRAIDGHRRILDCLKAKDPERIEDVVREHVEQSKKDILRYAFDRQPSGSNG
ncbi:MAG: GntR family transcriptional regulator [Desulfobacteraceae bacterium]|nr:MAG: GntR family transcriptional regulator [Desulfobacteraceae bacterium]